MSHKFKGIGKHQLNERTREKIKEITELVKQQDNTKTEINKR